LNIVPTTETERVMRSLGIRMVLRDFGTELFYNAGANSDGQLLQTEAPVRLSFILRPEDHLFLNYTDLPLTVGDSSIRYISNLSPQPEQPAGTFNFANGQKLSAHPSIFSLEVNAPGSPISLKDELGNEIFTFSGADDSGETPPQISLMEEDGRKIQLNLTGQPAGHYTLMEEDEVLQQFILAPENWLTGDLGLLSIYVGNTGPHGIHMLNDGVVTPQDFSMVFTARKTQWRYYLIDSANNGFTNTHLLDAKSQQPISPPAEDPVDKQLPDGSTAIVLTVPTAISLQQRPGNRFILSIKPPHSAAITIPLPSADANRISRDEDAQESSAFYSDMYVYL
ncbi:MAG: hypothetical protein AB8H12_08180, partial [Lewinella sp.]